MPICEAFKLAKAAVEFEINVGSSNMFKMLLFEEVKVLESFGALKQDPHKCCVFGPLEHGKFKNLTEKALIKYFPPEMNALSNRTREMYDLM